MKRIIPIICLACTLIMTIVASFFAYAWYVNTVKSSTEDVSLSSKGLIISYKINDSQKESPKTVNVSGLTFFDIDNEYEGYYLSDMAIKLTVVITNNSSASTDITVSEVLPESLENPYLKSFITDIDLDEKNADGTYLNEDYRSNPTKKRVYTNQSSSSNEVNSINGSVINYLNYLENSDKKITDTYTIEGLECVDNDKTQDRSISSKKLYIYIFGVQPNDDATNEFLDQSVVYDYKFKIEAEIAGEEAASVEGSTQVSSSSNLVASN